MALSELTPSNVFPKVTLTDPVVLGDGIEFEILDLELVVFGAVTSPKLSPVSGLLLRVFKME